MFQKRPAAGLAGGGKEERERWNTIADVAREAAESDATGAGTEFIVSRGDPGVSSASTSTSGGAVLGGVERPVDLLASTPEKLLELVRGWGWHRKDVPIQLDDGSTREWILGKKSIALDQIEFVVVDEADILFSEFLSRTSFKSAD
jgi:hypothetical protein